MAAEPLRVSEAARRLGLSTRDVLVLINERRIDYVIIRGMAHVPPEAIEDFQRQSA